MILKIVYRFRSNNILLIYNSVLKYYQEELSINIRVFNETRTSKIKTQYIPIIEHVIKGYIEIIGIDFINNIRLMGSVPRGDAIEFHSDIDFIAVTTAIIPERKQKALIDLALTIHTQFPVVSRIDLEVISMDCLGLGREFILRTDSISLYGDDIYTCSFEDIDSNKLANNNTPNLNMLIMDYRNRISNSIDSEIIKKVSRWIGKDILKSLRQRLILEKGLYEKSIHKLYEGMTENFPDQKSIFNRLFDVYIKPTNDKVMLLKLLVDIEEIAEQYTFHIRL